MSNAIKIVHIKELPKKALTIIEQYQHLSIGQHRVVTPYFINEDKRFHLRRVTCGKGRPEEIEKETVRRAKQKTFDLTQASLQQIRFFMQQEGIGIDCSGFVVWVLNEWCVDVYHKPFWKVIDYEEKNLFKKLRNYFRPVHNIGVKWLASHKNSVETSLADIQPGDLIITKNKQHVYVITRIGYNFSNSPVWFECANSKSDYGVKSDRVLLRKGTSELAKQAWIDLTTGKKTSQSDLDHYLSNGKVVRLRMFVNKRYA